MKNVYLRTMCVFLAVALSSCSEDDGSSNSNALKPTINPTSTVLVQCDANPNEQCIEITLPCTEPEVYGKAGWHEHTCTDEVIQIPNGRPIYAFLVNGFDQNKDFELFHFYNFAKCIYRQTEDYDQKAYVHFAWWNNLLAPYMKKPLHNDESVPSKVHGALDASADYAGFLYDPNKLTPGLIPGTYISGYPTKAIPAEDYQFQKDAKAVLEAIREHNSEAAIILVGHSMGGDAVIRLAGSMPANFKIDLLAPIDPVGNRTCLPNSPLANPAQMVWHNSTCDGAYNFTRFQATHTDWYWYPYRISFENKNIKYLFHRWQNEFAFPFDWGCPLKTGLCPWQIHMLLLPLDEFNLPDAYLFRHDEIRKLGINQGSTNVQDRILMNPESGIDVFPDGDFGGLFDGHGEIVGFRGLNPDNLAQSYPLALAARGTWPSKLSRSKENCDSDDLSPINCERVQVLKQWEADSEHLEKNGHIINDFGEDEYWAPQKPPQAYCDERDFAYDSDYCTYCMVSGDLCSILATLDLSPVADAGPHQTIECSSTDGTGVTLDGSDSTDPNGDALTYTWTGPFDTMIGETIYVYLPAGTHTITLTVEDSSGNTDSDTVNVTVIDSTPPTLSVSLSPNTLWPPNHKMVEINASVEVYDSCDNNPSVTLVSITSNEADDAKGDGHTSDDIQGADWGTNDREFSLRAERAGMGTGRVYTVTYQAMDKASNASEATAEVTVSHNQKK